MSDDTWGTYEIGKQIKLYISMLTSSPYDYSDAYIRTPVHCEEKHDNYEGRSR